MTPRDDLDQFTTMLDRGTREQSPRAEQPDPEVVARRRRGRRRGLIAWGVVLLVVVAAVATYIPVTLNAPIGAAKVQLEAPKPDQPTTTPFAMPKDGESAVSVTGDFASIAGAKELTDAAGGAGALPMASISKLVTAMVILQAKPLQPGQAGPTITFSADDSKLYDTYYVQQLTIEPMPANSTMSESDALKTILIASAANYAEVVSTWAYGSQAAFVSAAKKWLVANGLNNTRFVEPIGLDARDVSTPGDLIALGRLAMANPVIASIVAMDGATVGSIGGIPSTNGLLGHDGVDGIKTGTLANGSDLLFSAHLNVAVNAIPVTVVGVVLGGVSRDEVDTQVAGLLQSIQTSFQELKVQGDDVQYGTYTTPWGDRATVVTGADASLLVYGPAKVTSSVVTKPLSDARDGAKVGTVTFCAGTQVTSVPLVLKGSITPPSAWWRLTHPQQVFG